MKNNIEYYRHHAHSDTHPKFKMFRKVYGWAGEGKFWALNNRIALAEGCILDITKKYNKASIANDLDFSVSELDAFIKFLIDECELLFETEAGFLTTEQVQENFFKVSKSRNWHKSNYESRKKDTNNTVPVIEKPIQDLENDIPVVDLIQSKVKQSKVKQSKVKKAPREAVEIIINDLNSRLNTKYSIYSKGTTDLVSKRLADGFKVQDFITVNEKKCKQWKDNPDFCSYLRPETLYSNKFEGYLNQIIKEPSDKNNTSSKVDNAINELKEECDKTGRTISNLEAPNSSLSQLPSY